MRALIHRVAMLALAAALGNAAFTNVGHAQGTPIASAPPAAPTAPTFTKQALDNNGAPLTGPVSVGQTIQYVLSYNPGTSALGSVAIDDALSPNLAYVNPSIVAPPGWTWTPGPGPSPPVPYSVGNQETYNNAGFGPGMGFILNVAVGVGQAGAGGDGFAPIPVPAVNRVLATYHHQIYGSAKVNCWEAASLAPCPGYPQTLDTSTTDQRTTPQKPLAVVRGTKVYYPSARFDAGNNKTFLGIGCFDAAGAGAPCPFIDLPGLPSLSGQVGGQSLNPYLAGVVADPTGTQLYIYARDRVHCMNVSGISPVACPLFVASPTLLGTGTHQTHIIALEGTPKLAVMYGAPAGNKATLTCLDQATGARCPGWTVDPQAPSATASYGALSVLPDVNNVTTIAICLHPNAGINLQHECYNVANGAASFAANVTALKTAMANKFVIDSFHIPGTRRVLYGQYTSPMDCFDFGPGTSCTPFTPFWGPTTSSFFKDYGYAVDPADPERCLLGLGHAGELWRFARDGTACNKAVEVEAKFDINSFFCAIKPKQPMWGSVVIKNRPAQLTGGTINLVGGSGPVVPSITVGAANSYAVNVPATGANSNVIIQFTPTYSSQPAAGYQLELTFTADVDPQICYQATVKACGPASNKATIAGSIIGAAAPVSFKASAGVDLGNATGPECEPGLLKVCKVAGPGITIGTPFNFIAGSRRLSVPAGPAPGGTCMIGPTFPVGSHVTVDEAVPIGHTVSSIAVAPPKQLVGTPNLAGGSVNVTIGTGVTMVTFIDKLTGFLEICKRGEVSGNFSFTVSPGGLGPFVVPAGACSPPIEVVAGLVTVTELPASGTVMTGCATFPAGQQGLCDTNAQTSTVTVAPGDVSTETIAFITNRRQ